MVTLLHVLIALEVGLMATYAFSILCPIRGRKKRANQPGVSAQTANHPESK